MKSRLSFSAVMLALFCSLLIASAPSHAAEQVADDTWVVNIKEADIHEFVSQVAQITGKTFVIDPRLKGNVTVVSSVPMNADAVYELFLSVLRVHNFTASPSGDVIRIQTTATGKQGPGPDGEVQELPPEELITRVIAAQNVESGELVKILRPLIPQYGHIAAVAQPNIVIISDHANNIERLTRMIEQIDVADEDEITVVPLREAWVGTVVALLEKLAPEQIGQGATGPQRIQLIANERNNSIVVRGKPRPTAEILKLIDKLDQPATTTGGAQVFRLNHADAVDVANILSALLAGNERGESAEPTTIQADESLNAIVARANPGTINELREILDKLDVRRTQVLIEAAVVEVNLSDREDIGVETAIADGGGDTVPLASTSLSGVVSQLLNNLTEEGADGEQVNIDVLAGLASVSSPTLAAARINPDGISFGGIITALATSSDANLLSTPSIMALDNQEATIVVGQQVPFRTGSFTTTGDGSSNPFTTVQREDVGLTLKVTPHVHDGTSVRMEVDQEITNIVETPIGDAGFADVVTSKRQITTTILAEDQQIIVLGGLIQDNVTQTRRKVPLLGDIPGLGFFFRSTGDSRTKTNLLVFLRPTVIKTVQDVESSAERKYRDIWEVEITSPVEGQIEGLFEGEHLRGSSASEGTPNG
ncbi:MAG: type II secretion system protein GspD [Gammaproteobacteria bacterium]|nr:type II secretion system protein GspD [Gammaproteobacteria bacterium]MYE52354.1 type II secretion system protein GspD [Gammaproteobacteria bacterium]MYF49777.1 type II secretion system protein GspD [Gammaproteobacteria bacterium]